MWFRPSYDFLLAQLPTDRDSHFCEVGVYHGQSLCYLGVEIVNRHLPVTIHAVDSFQGWPGVLQGQALRDSFDHNTAPLRAVLNGRFQVHPLSSVEAAATFPDASLDVIWIDADHAYPAVKADLEAWWPKLKLGGWMGGDDWCMTGVAWAVHERFGTDHVLIPGYRKDGDFEGPWPSWLKQKDA
jgi:hypothetical protein